MSKIPTKAELAREKADQSEADRQKLIESEISEFTNSIVAAMRRGETSLPVAFCMPEPETQTQLKKKFAPEWTLTFIGARTGGTIRWQ